jgi:hypothetical protein
MARAAIRALLGHPNTRVGLEATLNAVAADRTPRAQDPMWPDLVQGVSKMWDAVTINHGRDMVMLEQRPKPRDLLMESLAAVNPQKIGDEQQQLLAQDLIDLYASAGPDQRPALERALQQMAGTDVVEILNGRGLKAGGAALPAVVKAQQDLESARRQNRRTLDDLAKEAQTAPPAK